MQRETGMLFLLFILRGLVIVLFKSKIDLINMVLR